MILGKGKVKSFHANLDPILMNVGGQWPVFVAKPQTVPLCCSSYWQSKNKFVFLDVGRGVAWAG